MIAITHPKSDEDFLRLDQLSSQVFLSHMPGESMARRYSGLIGKGNARHINLIKEDGMPVSCVNWYPVTVAIGDARLSVGQIGGVCTHSSHRGKGYAEALLRYSFGQMKEEGVSLCVISGDRGLYRRNGARHFLRMLPFLFSSPGSMDKITYLPPARLAEGANEVYTLHECQDIRIVRSLLRVKEELLAFGESHHGYKGHLFLTDAAYIVVSVSANHKKPMGLTEHCGSPADLLRLFGAAVAKFRRPLSGQLFPREKEAFPFLSTGAPQTPEMTAKIICPERLISSLAPLFSACGMAPVTLVEAGNSFLLTTNRASFSLSEEELFSALFFGDSRLGTAFPLPLPDFHSMDYQ